MFCLLTSGCLHLFIPLFFYEFVLSCCFVVLQVLFQCFSFFLRKKKTKKKRNWWCFLKIFPCNRNCENSIVVLNFIFHTTCYETLTSQILPRFFERCVRYFLKYWQLLWWPPCRLKELLMNIISKNTFMKVRLDLKAQFTFISNLRAVISFFFLYRSSFFVLHLAMCVVEKKAFHALLTFHFLREDISININSSWSSSSESLNAPFTIP